MWRVFVVTIFIPVLCNSFLSRRVPVPLRATTGTSSENDKVPVPATPQKEVRKRTKTTPDLRWDMCAVGVAESPYNEKFGIPRQATISAKIKADDDTTGTSSDGRIVMFQGFEDCIAEIDGFDYIWVLSLMHLNSGFKKKIRPMPASYAENRPPSEVGLFASRSPHRPNPIALSGRHS